MIFRIITQNSSLDTSDEIARWLIPENLTNEKPTLVQVMTWYRHATSHYLSQCWPRFMLAHGVTKPQWVKEYIFTFNWESSPIFSHSHLPPITVMSQYPYGALNHRQHTCVLNSLFTKKHFTVPLWGEAIGELRSHEERVMSLYNSSALCAAYMRQWTGSALVQVMACRLLGGQAITRCNAGSLQIRLLGTNFSEFRIGILSFSLQNAFGIVVCQNGVHFVEGKMR